MKIRELSLGPTFDDLLPWGALQPLDRQLIPSGEPCPRGSDRCRFALTHPDVDVALCSAKTTDELREALHAQEESKRCRRISVASKKAA